MSSTANARWRIPRVFVGACRLSPRFDGDWNFTSSSRPLPAGMLGWPSAPRQEGHCQPDPRRRQFRYPRGEARGGEGGVEDLVAFVEGNETEPLSMTFTSTRRAAR